MFVRWSPERMKLLYLLFEGVELDQATDEKHVVSVHTHPIVLTRNILCQRCVRRSPLQLPQYASINGYRRGECHARQITG